MQGYDPDQHRRAEPGGCRETILITRIAFEILLPPVGVIIGVLVLMVGTLLLLMSGQPLFAILTLSPIVGGFIWIVRRDRRVQAELEEEIRGGPPRS